ncbi:unnamed protein product [Protopolystoma xenopodis]|uniref:Ubiquitin-like protease family profile domain-containing protein n=1 Tax=Protopolystoma xenopodis TaxID=117903 RepID=A0A3S5FE13_9PLAT|nr:unnamed protein product [Protopolystoma xenopodis]
MRIPFHPEGAPDSISLTSEDLACLAPNIFLNDTIINFYLRYLYYEQLTALQRRSTYLFNSFFYNRLVSIKGAFLESSPGVLSNDTLNGSINCSSAQMTLHHPVHINTQEAKLAHHANVAKWTRRVDLFSKDHIIIPINENSHWFLGLVCYPWMAGMVSYTALYQAAAFDLCRLTDDFVDVDQMEISDEENATEEVIEYLPTDTRVNLYSFLHF